MADATWCPNPRLKPNVCFASPSASLVHRQYQSAYRHNWAETMDD